MSLVDIRVYGLETALSNMATAQALMDRLGEGLLEVVNEVVVPAIQDASSTVWGVRTGNYQGSWYAELTDPNTVTITNLAQNERGDFYAAPLEFGWTTRNGGFVESEGVGYPVTLESVDAISLGLATWLMSQLPQ